MPTERPMPPERPTPAERTSAVPGGETEELVVLLDEDGRPRGTAPKASVHGAATPLHLAFSLHLRRPDGRILLTRRALTKRTWPGVWTNALCGHPGPGEEMDSAIRRRAGQELNLDAAAIGDLRVLSPTFRYRATDAGGVVENEICPVFLADYRGDADALPAPEPAEVMDRAWVRWEDVAAAGTGAPFLLSPWLVAHVGDPGIEAVLRAAPTGSQEASASSAPADRAGTTR